MERAECVLHENRIDFNAQFSSLAKMCKRVVMERHGPSISLGKSIPNYLGAFEKFAENPNKLSLIKDAYLLQREHILSSESILEFVCEEFNLAPFLEDAKSLRDEELNLVSMGVQEEATIKSIYDKTLNLHLYRIFTLICGEEDKPMLAYRIFSLETQMNTKTKTAALKPIKAKPFIVTIGDQSREISIQEIPPGKALQAIFFHFFEKELPEHMVSGISGIKENEKMAPILQMMKPLLDMMLNSNDPNNQMSKEELMAMVAKFGMPNLFGGQ